MSEKTPYAIILRGGRLGMFFAFQAAGLFCWVWEDLEWCDWGLSVSSEEVGGWAVSVQPWFLPLGMAEVSGLVLAAKARQSRVSAFSGSRVWRRFSETA